MNKKGFVLIETIVVVLALCILLVTLYSSFSNVISVSKNDSEYDNTEYIYKALLIKNCLQELGKKPENYLNYKVCENSADCLNKNYSLYYNDLIQKLGVNGIYIMPWEKSDVNSDYISNLFVTTQKYYRYLDPKSCDDNCQRIIVMFKDENANNDYTYQYASLKYEVTS